MSQRVLILGGGFGGIYAALRLEKLLKRGNDIEVTLITRDNFIAHYGKAKLSLSDAINASLPMR